MPRLKRPIVERERPVRSWAAAMNTPPPAPAPSPATGGSDPDPIVRGVVSGNRVVEDWMRQAQHTARLLGANSAGSGWADASGRMLKTASDVMSTWWSMFGMAQGPPAVNGNGTAVPSPPPFSAPPTGNEVTSDSRETASTVTDARPAERAASPVRVTVDVKSRQAVSVTVDVRHVSITDIRVLDLRPERGKARRIRGTTATISESEGLRLQVSIPDNQPPGTYHGVIVDRAQDRAVGTVTVRVLAG